MSKFFAVALGIVPLWFVSGTHAEHADTSNLLQTFSSAGRTASTFAAAAGAVTAVDKSIVNATCSCQSVWDRCGHQVCPGCPVKQCHCPAYSSCRRLADECCIGTSKRARSPRKCIEGKIKAGIQVRLKSAHDTENHAIKKDEYSIQMLNDTFNEQDAEWNAEWNHEKKLHDMMAMQKRKREETKWQAMRHSHKEINKRQTARQTQWETWQASRSMGAAVQRVLYKVQGKPVRDEPLIMHFERPQLPYCPPCYHAPCPPPPLCHACRPARCPPCAPQRPCAISENKKCKAEFKAVQDAIKAYNL